MRKPNFVVQPTPSTYFAHRENGSEEMRWGPAAEYGETVPNDRFYIHNRAIPPRLDPKTYKLEVMGSGVARPRSFTYDEILALPSVTCRRTLDCGVNCRAFFPKVSPYRSTTWLPVGYTQWHFGAVGAAEWTGVRVKDLLAAAGLGEAVDVRFTGLDAVDVEGGRLPYAEVIPIEKVLASDSLLVYRMNGDVLPVDHGYPLRVIFSGWGGNAAVKWLGSVEVSKEPLPLTRFQQNQVIAGPDFPRPHVGGAAPVRSALEIDEELTIQPGDHVLRGRAWSGSGAIAAVDVCVERLVAPDTWVAVWNPPFRRATLLHAAEPMMWVRFEIPWRSVEPGYYRLMSRATDDAGNTQPRPEDVLWNEHGIGYNGHAPLGIAVSPLSAKP